MIDQSLREYLRERFEAMEKLIASEIRGITDKLSDALGTVREDVSRLRGDISDLYQKDRDQTALISTLRENLSSRIGQADNRISKLEESRDQKDKSSSRTTTILSVIIAGLGVLFALWSLLR